MMHILRQDLLEDTMQLLHRRTVDVACAAPRLEQAIWTDAETETRDGIACNVGAPTCVGGRKGRMTEVRASAADIARSKDILANQVLPGWLKRCGAQCAQPWKQTVGAATGVELR
jgi:hypothetical protein